jgi:hypothetical protein
MLISPEERAAKYGLLLGIGWIVLGVVLLARPGTGVDALAVVVGVALVVNGIVEIVKAIARRQDEPVAEFIGGASSIVFGVLALSWPDLTVFVVAVLFGARTVLFGLSQLFSLIVSRWRSSRAGTPAPGRVSRGWFGRGVRVATRLVALVVALGLLGISVGVRNKAPAAVPTFYDAPSTVPPKPGVLLRSEPMSASIPKDAQGWRILYTTKTSLGHPAVGSAFVLAAKHPPAGRGRSSCGTMGQLGSRGRVRRRCSRTSAKVCRRSLRHSPTVG